jgi:2-polyprenyl-3-methyl-5-hydroxy-6-metoxy-1,4-benzoquinol methylase
MLHWVVTVITGNTHAVARWPEGGLENVPQCPVCSGDRREAVYNDLTDEVFRCAPGRWNLKRCLDCGSAYLDPRPTLSTISLAYSTYYTHARTGAVNPKGSSWLRRWRIAQRNHFLNKNYGYRLRPSASTLFFLSNNRRRRFDRYAGYLRFPGPGARFLDVGCGNGSFLLQMQSLGWEVCGVEPDRKSAEQAQVAGLNVRVGYLPEAALPELHFDAIMLSHVIEHLHDPVTTLLCCWKLLKPGGTMVILTPNYEASGRIRFERHWRGLETPRHLVLFTENSLWKMMERCGFTVSRISRPSLSARTMFRTSYLLRCQSQCSQPPGRLPWLLRLKSDWLAFKADQETKADPRRTEELILLGAKNCRS